MTCKKCTCCPECGYYNVLKDDLSQEAIWTQAVCDGLRGFQTTGSMSGVTAAFRAVTAADQVLEAFEHRFPDVNPDPASITEKGS